ncbi:uncharacterized protein G2W53_018193 [Senna tora]|uniref:Uncharacterized protein n=1 Tax=Senna tora TaxID=362788 RepID=A0A834WRG6_9FABA|nr:uncharacterized protein G2W53_018193 [Senna tora]
MDSILANLAYKHSEINIFNWGLHRVVGFLITWFTISNSSES